MISTLPSNDYFPAKILSFKMRVTIFVVFCKGNEKMDNSDQKTIGYVDFMTGGFILGSRQERP